MTEPAVNESVPASPEPEPTSTPLQVSFDEDGRPYDAVLRSSVEWRDLTTLVTETGEVAIMDGNAVHVSPAAFAAEGTRVQFDTTSLDVSVAWERRNNEDTEWEVVLGVLVAEPDTVVSAWGDFEYAYGTDGGVGAVVAAELLALDAPTDQEFFLDVADEDVAVYDVWPDTPGNDVVIFRNGFGDGSFPMSRGFDADGDLVAVFVFDYGRHPWRLLFPEIPPPAEVTQREEELIECVEGRRPVTDRGWCYSDV